ncbi:MAG: hypothetical protein AAF531_21210 [Actinomycetota bacterium]
MSQDHETNRFGSPHLGPVTPPSLGEVYEISTRRQRTRYRFIQGTLVAVAVAGVGIGLQTRGGESIATPADGGVADGAAGGAEGSTASDGAATTQDGEDTVQDGENTVQDGEDTVQDGEDTAAAGAGDAEDTVPPTTQPEAAAESAEAVSPDRIDCSDPVTTDWIQDARSAYVDESPVPIEDLEALADNWVIPVFEVKSLVGMADQVGTTLVNETLDEAFFDWYDQGYTAEQLADIADQWNVSTISVKVLRLIGGPQADAALDGCGLAPVREG